MSDIVETSTATNDSVRGVEIMVPLGKLKKSPRNARKVPHGEAAILALAASIKAKGVLQPPVVEPERNAEGESTGRYLVTAGEGRRLALLSLAKSRVMRKSDPVRCTLDTVNDPHEISLDENVTRTPMHPADQFEAFKRLADERGYGAEEIGARFGVSAHVVRQRLRLGAVSPKLLEIYREEGLNLDQLMAFAIHEDHARQEQVFANLHHNREPWIIRRDMTANNVPARDRRARFIGAAAYAEAGGAVIRDLFTEDDGGYFADAGLLDMLVDEQLAEHAARLREDEGWNWVASSRDFPHDHGMRRCYPREVQLSEAQEARFAEASAAHDALLEGYDSYDELPEDVAARADALESEIDALNAKRRAFDPDVVARGGAFVCLDHDGGLRIERGFVRAEDEAPEPQAEAEAEASGELGAEAEAHTEGEEEAEPVEDEEADAPVSDILVRDLTAHRTLALRLALGEQPEIALIAITHALVAQTFYRFAQVSCLELRPTMTPLGSHADGIEDASAALALSERHERLAMGLPEDPARLWTCIVAMDCDDRLALLAHCAALTVNALRLPWDRKPAALVHADALATAVALDMTEHWTPTAASYFGRVTKANIGAAVGEAVSEEAAERIAGLRKSEMAETAAGLVAGTGWLPQLLRTAPADLADKEGEGEAMAIAAE